MKTEKNGNHSALHYSTSPAFSLRILQCGPAGFLWLWQYPTFWWRRDTVFERREWARITWETKEIFDCNYGRKVFLRKSVPATCWRGPEKQFLCLHKIGFSEVRPLNQEGFSPGFKHLICVIWNAVTVGHHRLMWHPNLYLSGTWLMPCFGRIESKTSGGIRSWLQDAGGREHRCDVLTMDKALRKREAVFCPSWSMHGLLTLPAWREGWHSQKWKG